MILTKSYTQHSPAAAILKKEKKKIQHFFLTDKADIAFETCFHALCCILPASPPILALDFHCQSMESTPQALTGATARR